MAQTEGIKRRIGGIQNTAKITKAMQLVSAVKMKRIVESFQNSRAYLDGIASILSQIVKTNAEISNPLLEKREVINKALVVVIGTTRGYVGAQLSKLGTYVYEEVNKLNDKNIKVEFLTVKNKALNTIARYGFTSNNHFDKTFEDLNPTDIDAIKKIIIDGFISKEFDQIYLAYSEYRSNLYQVPVMRQFLPLSISEITESANVETVVKPFLFEPSSEAILTKLLEDYVEISILQSILSATASEYAARMVAMQKASDNAKEVTKRLQLLYNKSRQASITQQIQEIVNANLYG